MIKELEKNYTKVQRFAKAGTPQVWEMQLADICAKKGVMIRGFRPMKKSKARRLLDRLAILLSSQAGSVNLGGIVIMGVAFIIVGLAIRFLPAMITSFGTAYTAANTTENIAAFPGLTDVLGFGPVGIVLGFICAVAFVGFLGLRNMFSSKG